MFYGMKLLWLSCIINGPCLMCNWTELECVYVFGSGQSRLPPLELAQRLEMLREVDEEVVSYAVTLTILGPMNLTLTIWIHRINVWKR